ncbi:hypothetical protein FS837_008769 [Tulasnella sp. UAMH 9824]|nr:hypothetical protein FS837_008769 [Tulasnella sp. UAMH 9824]
MAVQPPPPAPSAAVLDKDALSKLKRPEIQALCKACSTLNPFFSNANNLRAIGTTGSLIDSLTVYFETLTVGKRDTKAHVTPKPASRLWKSSSQKTQVPSSQDAATPVTTQGPPPALNGSTLKSKPSVESLSAKPGVRRPSLRIPSTRSRLSSSASLSPMVTETDADAGTTTEVSSVVPDNQLLSPANAAATPRNAISPTPSNRSLASSVRPVRKLAESTTAKPKTAPTASKAAGKSTQSFPTASQGLSASTSTKPTSAPIRRTSITPSVTSQARSPQSLRTRLSSHTSLAPSSVVSPIRSVQTEIAELSASLKAVEDARVEQVAALTERIAAQDVALQAQNDLVRTLQQTVKEMHELLVSTRQDLLEACKVDVASCVSQSSILTQAFSELEKRMDVVEAEVFDEGGKMEGLVREMGDVDVAMASERDRVSYLETRIGELEVKVDDVIGESTVPTSASSSSFRIRKNSKKLSMSGPGVVRQRKQSVVRDSNESSPQDAADLFSRDRRLSRASISASIHASTPLSPVLSGVAFPSTNKRPSIKPPFSGTKQEFKFPPPPPQKSTEPRSRTISATARRTKTPEPYLADPSPFGGKALHRTPPAYGDDGEDDHDPQSPTDDDGLEDRTMRFDTIASRHEEEQSSEDERVTPPIPPRPTRTSTTKRIAAPTASARTLPSILVNNEKPENSNSSSLASVVSDGAVSVSISDLDVAGGITTDDDGMARRGRGISAAELHDSLLHQPQPSFGGLTTDDEFDADGADEMSHTVILSSVPPPRNKNQRT